MNTKTLHKTSHATNFGKTPDRLTMSRRSRIGALLAAAFITLNGIAQAETNPIITGYKYGTGGIFNNCSGLVPFNGPGYALSALVAWCEGRLNQLAPGAKISTFSGEDGLVLAVVKFKEGGLSEKFSFAQQYFKCPGSAGSQGVCDNLPPPLNVPDVGGQCPAQAGNPIQIASGAKVQSEVDYAGPDGLSFVRTYRSTTGYFESALTSAARRMPVPTYVNYTYYDALYGSTGKPLVEPGTGLPVFREVNSSDGESDSTTYDLDLINQETHWPLNKQSFMIPSGEWLVDGINGTSVIQNGDITEFTDRNGNVTRYNKAGKLIESWTIGNYANRLKYTYDKDENGQDGQVSEINASTGRKLKFSYINSLYRYKRKLLSKMIDPNDGIYQYEYDDHDNLTKVTYPDGTSRKYLYNENLPYFPAGSQSPVAHHHALTGIIDENGIRYATFTYDANGKGSSTYHYGSVNDNPNQIIEKYTFNYKDGKTIVTDPLGKDYSYNYEKRYGSRRITSASQPLAGGSGCIAGTSSSTYDDKGNVKTTKDFNGYLTIYEYNDQDQEVSRTEGLNADKSPRPETKTIHTEWDPDKKLDPSLKLPTKITEEYKNADGTPGKDRITTFTYVSKAENPLAFGNLKSLSIEADDGTGQATKTLTWNYSYYSSGPSAGKIMSITNPTGDSSSFSYYDNGDPYQVIEPSGLTTTFTDYDKYGNATTIASADGVINKLVYNTRGQITSRTVGTFTTTYRYHDTGQVKQVISPNGSTVSFNYDTGYRLTDIIDSAGNSIHYTLDTAGNRIKEEIKGSDGKTLQSLSREIDNLGRVKLVKGAYNNDEAETTQNVSNVSIAGNVKWITDQYGRGEPSGILTGKYTSTSKISPTFRWLRHEKPILGATGTSYKLSFEDIGAALVFEVTPAANGNIATSPVRSAVKQIAGPAAPTATDVRIIGKVEVNQTLTGDYVYIDDNSDSEGTSSFQWLSDGKTVGKGKTYKVTNSDAGKELVFEVTPVAKVDPKRGYAVQSSPSVASPYPPTASNVRIERNGVVISNSSNEDIKVDLAVGDVLTGKYVYDDAEHDPELLNAKGEPNSQYRWLLNGTPISGANDRAYKITANNLAGGTKPIMTFEVTPVSKANPQFPKATTEGDPARALVNGSSAPSAPTAKNVILSGDCPNPSGYPSGYASTIRTLGVSYKYEDPNGDPQGGSIVEWLRGGNVVSKVIVKKGNVAQYNTSNADANSTISVRVTPVSSVEPKIGNTVSGNRTITVTDKNYCPSN